MSKIPEKSSQEYLDAILDKDQNDLTEDDKAFLRARSSYLTGQQKEDLAKVLKEKPSEPSDPRANEGGQQKTPASAVDEIIKGRKLEEVPTKQLNKVADALGIPEESKKNRAQLEDAIRTKLGPEADQEPK